MAIMTRTRRWIPMLIFLSARPRDAALGDREDSDTSHQFPGNDQEYSERDARVSAL